MTTILGNKRACIQCGAKFYDLGKNPAPCPKCKAMNDIHAPLKSRRKAKATVEVDQDDPLVKQTAKQTAKNAPKKAGKKVEGIDLGEFEDIAPMDGEEEIEEIEEMEDIEDLEELEDAEPDEESDEEGMGIDDDTLIDDIEEEDGDEEEEEEAPKAKKKPAAKPAPKKKKK